MTHTNTTSNTTFASTFTITLGSLVREHVLATELNEACTALIAANGGDGTGITVTADVPAPAALAVVAPSDVAIAAPKYTATSTIVDGVVQNAVNLDRLQDQEKMAAAAGFSCRAPIYELGTRVNDLGVANARRSQQEWAAQPAVGQNMAGLISRVAAEQRRDRVVPLSSIRMADAGNLVVAIDGNGAGPKRVEVALAERAFGSLLARTGIGGADYLTRCWPKLRATNVNEWLAREATADDQVTLRVRNATDGSAQAREVFAVVSPKYQGGFGVDQIAKAVARAVDPSAHGTVDYDGYRAKITALWHAPTLPENYCAGEMFKAGVVIRTDDTGGGSVKISAVVFRNLCLNLIIVDEATQRIDAIRHVGDLDTLVARFVEAFRNANAKIEGFRAAWGFANADDVVAKVTDEDLTGRTIADVLPGLFNGIVERDLVPIRGKRVEVVRGLLASYDREPVKHDRLTRSDVVNAFTRYAHEGPVDTFEGHEIAASASALLFGKLAARPLPYEAITI